MVTQYKMSDSLVHLRVPAATKGRWVRISRAEGMRLTDWIIEAVEAHLTQQITNIEIPDDLDFSELRLARDADGAVTFDLSVIERICKDNDLPIELFVDAPEDNVSGLIGAWYQAHKQQGGDPNPVADDLIAEVIAEELAGQTVSHKPGCA